MISAALLVPVGVVASSGVAHAGNPNKAACSGHSGSAALKPGITFVTKKNQSVTLSGVGVANCTGGVVTAGTLNSGTALRSSTPVNCQGLLATAGTASAPRFTGSLVATWTAPTGMGTTTLAIAAYVTSSVGHSTSFHFSGGVPAQGNVFSGQHVTGNFTINKGLHSAASGGDCTVIGSIVAAGVTASNFKIG